MQSQGQVCNFLTNKQSQRRKEKTNLLSEPVASSQIIKSNKMTSDLSQQLLRQVGRFWSVERPRLWQSGDDGASSLRWREWMLIEKKLKYSTLMQMWSSPSVCSAHPVIFHHLPQVINQSELFWIHLMDSKKETRKTSYLWKRRDVTYEAWQDCQYVSSQHSYPPSWLWIFPRGHWHHPQPRPAESLTLAAHSAASAPSSPPPPHHCCSSHEWYPTAKETSHHNPPYNFSQREIKSSFIKPSVSPEGAARNVINCPKWCHLSQHPLGLKTTSLNMKKIWGVEFQGSELTRPPQAHLWLRLAAGCYSRC